MLYYISKLFFYRGIDSLHLSIGNIVLLCMGLLVSSFIISKTKKIRNGVITIALFIIVASFVAKHYQNGAVDALPQYLTPQIVIPSAILVIGAMVLLELFRRGSDYVLHFASTMLVMSLISGGYIFSYINSDLLGDFAKYIPFLLS